MRSRHLWCILVPTEGTVSQMALKDVDLNDLVHTYGATVGQHTIERIFRLVFELPLATLSAKEWQDVTVYVGPLPRFNLRRIYAIVSLKPVAGYL